MKKYKLGDLYEGKPVLGIYQYTRKKRFSRKLSPKVAQGKNSWVLVESQPNLFVSYLDMVSEYKKEKDSYGIENKISEFLSFEDLKKLGLNKHTNVKWFKVDDIQFNETGNLIKEIVNKINKELNE